MKRFFAVVVAAAVSLVAGCGDQGSMLAKPGGPMLAVAASTWGQGKLYYYPPSTEQELSHPSPPMTKMHSSRRFYEFSTSPGSSSSCQNWYIWDAPTADGGGSDPDPAKQPSIDFHNGPNELYDFRITSGAAYISTFAKPDNLTTESLIAPPPRAWPIVVTSHIGVGAQGTVFMVLIGGSLPGNGKEWVYVIEGDPAKPLLVADLGKDPAVEVTPDMYIEYDIRTSKLSGPKVAGQDLKDFANKFRLRAQGLDHSIP